MANTHSTDLEKSSSQYWSVADGSQSGLDFTGDMTIAMWVKFEALPTSGQTFCFIRKYGETGNNRSYMLRYLNAGGTLRFETRISTAGTGASTAVRTLDYNSFSAGTWYHIAFVYTASAQTIDIYVNGSSVGQTTTNGGSIYNGTADFAVGGHPDDGDYFDGLFNDVRSWGRALTSTEIGDLYTDGCTFDNGASVVSQWFVSDDGTDQIGSNDLTGGNSPTFSTDIAYTCGGAIQTYPTLSMLGVG